ncbi:hypothetical protein ACUHMQ_04345 [Chitinimonas sp. PSY-7]|uniref:hypothetical protein n=1 Tax=Chitinimonas sp. PSY-7 TaxID=3459088 RepID=UPI00403FEF24
MSKHFSNIFWAVMQSPSALPNNGHQDCLVWCMLPTAHTRKISSRSVQRGSALLAFFLVVSVAFLALIVSKLGQVVPPQNKSDEITDSALQAAKAALLGWTVSHADLPGLLLYPDRNNTDGDYDGTSDCPSISGNTSLLGSLPDKIDSNSANFGNCLADQNNSRPIGISYLRDGSGTKLWYAVSQNLLVGYPGSVDPDITTAWLGTPAPFLWLKICSGSGVPIDDVAFVIIAPGPPLVGQNRNAAAPAVSNFLEGIPNGGTGACAGPQSNADTDVNLTFVSTPQTNTFNDKLTYVTKRELINALVVRVINEIRSALDRFHSQYNEYSDAGDNSGECNANSNKNRLPLNNTNTNSGCQGKGLSSLPTWIRSETTKGWFLQTTYVKNSADQVTLTLSNCDTPFVFNWNNTTKRTDVMPSPLQCRKLAP